MMDQAFELSPLTGESAVSVVGACVIYRRDENKDGCHFERPSQAMCWRLKIQSKAFATGIQCFIKEEGYILLDQDLFCR